MLMQENKSIIYKQIATILRDVQNQVYTILLYTYDYLCPVSQCIQNSVLSPSLVKYVLLLYRSMWIEFQPINVFFFFRFAYIFICLALLHEVKKFTNGSQISFLEINYSSLYSVLNYFCRHIKVHTFTKNLIFLNYDKN